MHYLTGSRQGFSNQGEYSHSGHFDVRILRDATTDSPEVPLGDPNPVSREFECERDFYCLATRQVTAWNLLVDACTKRHICVTPDYRLHARSPCTAFRAVS